MIVPAAAGHDTPISRAREPFHDPGRTQAGSTEREKMPKPNYGFEKRQRELEKKRKKAEKVARKAAPQPATQPEPVQVPRDDNAAS